MHPLFRDVKNLLLDTLFPVHCLSCNQEGLFLCLICRSKLQRLTVQQCIVCRQTSSEGVTHAQCQGAGLPAGLISIFDYHDPLLAQAIIWGKYKFLPEVYHLLGKLLADHLAEQRSLCQLDSPVVCPVPLAKSRLRWRGFNQTQILSAQLAQTFGWPMAPLLERIKNTRVQKDLTKFERQTNVAGSFTPGRPSVIANSSVILVDDVITTGATLLEASRVLIRSGAASVWCLTLARD